MMQYNKGNLQKYHTKNPLKRFMINYFEQKLLNVVESLNLQNPEILDAGCGEGFVAGMLHAQNSQAHIFAFDYQQKAIDYAKEHQSPAINFSVGDICGINFADKTFDLVCCTEVLEHLPDPAKAVAELLRVADKYVVLSVPNEPWFCLGNLISGKNISRLGNPVDHINHYTGRGFVKFLRQCGAVKIKTFNCLVWTIAVVEK